MQITDKAINLQNLKQLFQKSADVKFQQYTFNQYKVHFITCDAMVDLHLLNEVIIQQMQLFFDNKTDESLKETDFSQLHIPNLKQVGELNEVVSLVYTGYLLIYFEVEQWLFSSNIAKKPNRNPEESRMEVAIKGPRDNFIEDIAVNIALIRKRVPTNSLCVEKLEVGRRSKTIVAILYFDDIANKEILNGIKKKLEKIDTDIIFSSEVLMENVDKSSVFFPRTDYSGRPDYAVQALARGRFLILVDGVSYAVITPVNLFLLLKTSEDHEYPLVFSSMERLMRIFGLVTALLLPAFWLALTTIHQNQMPLQLLATVVQANTGLPFPSAVEMIIMLIMFEVFREASLHLPSIIGGSISVVGGIIIGDASIRAGITSPAMIVIIATAFVASYTLNNQSLMTAVSVFRIIFIIVTSFFGLFGFFMTMYFLLIYLSGIRTFGVPYMNITADLSWSTIKKSLFRLPTKQYNERPNALDPQDQTRSKEVKK